MSGSSGQRKIVPLSHSPSNPDAEYVTKQLAERGVGDRQRSAVMWALMAAQLRSEQYPQLFADIEANPDAVFVLQELEARGIPLDQQADMMWGMMAAYLRGEVDQQGMLQSDDVDVDEIAALMDEW
jgi:hypothetical protein